MTGSMTTANKPEMGFQVSLTNPYQATTVKELLEDRLLIPRKIRHFLRIKKHVWVNDELINWQSPVKQGDHIKLRFDQEDYPEKSILMGKRSEDHTSELQSRQYLVCRLLLEKKQSRSLPRPRARLPPRSPPVPCGPPLPRLLPPARTL